MSHLTRRSFVKRTGAVTLGSALGLGLLPSVTRRLHAIDTSSVLTNVIADCPAAPKTTPASPDPNYPPGAPNAMLVLTISVTADFNRQCVPEIKITTTRTATYTKKVGTITHSATATNASWYKYKCKDGIPSFDESSSPNPQITVAISNNGGSLILRENGPGGVQARTYTDGDWRPWVFLDSSHSIACC